MSTMPSWTLRSPTRSRCCEVGLAQPAPAAARSLGRRSAAHAAECRFRFNGDVALLVADDAADAEVAVSYDTWKTRVPDDHPSVEDEHGEGRCECCCERCGAALSLDPIYGKVYA